SELQAHPRLSAAVGPGDRSRRSGAGDGNRADVLVGPRHVTDRRPEAPASSARAAGDRRCFGDGDPLFERYHDQEWGFPVLDERGLFERLSLEAFQSGLSWRTILARRDAFRVAFAGFQADVLARYGEHDVDRLLGDSSIIRNRAKIEATLANA